MLHRDVFKHLWDHFVGWCKQIGWCASIPFFLGPFACNLLGLAGTTWFVAAGAVFESMYGFVRGTLVAVLSCGMGMYPGGLLAFYLGRSRLRPRVQLYLDQSERLRIMNKIIETEGWKFAFAMRFSPLLPEGTFNYACALTSMTYRHNALASLGSFVPLVFEVWMSAEATRAVSSEATASGGSHIYVELGLNLLVLVVMAVLLVGVKKQYDSHAASLSDP